MKKKDPKFLCTQLEPGDILYGFTKPSILRNLFLTILDKSEKDELIFSIFSNKPTIASMNNNPFQWCEEKKYIADKHGNPAKFLYLSPFNLFKGGGVKTANRYKKRLIEIMETSQKRFQEIIKNNIETINKIEEAMGDPGLSKKDQIMSIILNEVFGPGNYTEEQMVIMTSIQSHFENTMIKKEKMIVDNILKNVEMHDFLINTEGIEV